MGGREGRGDRRKWSIPTTEGQGRWKHMLWARTSLSNFAPCEFCWFLSNFWVLVKISICTDWAMSLRLFCMSLKLSHGVAEVASWRNLPTRCSWREGEKGTLLMFPGLMVCQPGTACFTPDQPESSWVGWLFWCLMMIWDKFKMR